jgi:hypothetical protein
MPDPALGDIPRLAALILGRWEGSERVYYLPETEFHRPAEARCVCTSVFDDTAVRIDYTQLIAGKVTVRGHGLLQWDAAERQVMLRWWDTCRAVERLLRGRLTGHAMVLTSTDAPALSATWVFGPGETFLNLWEGSTDGTRWDTRTIGNFQAAGLRPLPDLPTAAPETNYLSDLTTA